VAEASYRIAPIYLIRMAGVPFDILEKISTPKTSAAARELIAFETKFSQTKLVVERLIAARRNQVSKEQFRFWRKAIRSGVMPEAADPLSSTFANCWRGAKKVATAEAALAERLAQDLTGARGLLFEAARKYLPAYLVFAASGVRDRVIDQLSSCDISLPARNKQARADERHLVLYLQRIAGKNDSLSQFGPESWGSIDFGTKKIVFTPQPGIAKRETFLERWAAHGAAAAINADPETAAEISPRLHPNGRIEQDHFVFAESGELLSLDRQTLNLLARCDGKTPAHLLGVNLDVLHQLALQNLIQWEMEVPALEAHAFEVLLRDVSRWRDGPARTRWLEQLQALAKLPDKFARASEPFDRLAIITEATNGLEKLGAHKSATRFLYSATNPIGEECFRECNFSISERLIDEVAIEAARWIDLWRDNYAFVASRVAAGLRALLEQAPLNNGALPLPAFLRHCANLKMALTGPGMVAFAHLAFTEVKEAFRRRMEGRTELPELKLSAEDCHFVRQEFSYPKFDEFTYPSADLQLAAPSLEAVARGQYRWILAELHPSVALLHHGFYWACPDKPALAQALEQTLFGQPNLFYGYFAADFTATTTVRFDALPHATNFVATQRTIGTWQAFHPAETEVFIDDETADIGVRTRGSHQYLGSFARGWVIPLGFHPFFFSLGKHTPRLTCGNVVVQRRSWTVTLEELGPGDFTGVSRDLVVAVEKLRAARELPRHVYIRPTEQALRRSGVEGRDKDTKPVYIDFESYLFLEIFHRWLTKAGELEVTEMLPTPDQLLWREPDGRRTFEIRTQIIPR
jgi:hypothetical protein